MKRNALFPNMKGFVHGGDYNPEQWLDRPDILEKDIELMKKAGVNSATLGVFSWSVYEPVEGEFHFDWLEQIMDNLYENGIYTVLATPSGARPSWLDATYPDSMRCDEYGNRNHHGIRHNHCMTSEAYRKKVEIMDTKLAERFAKHPGLLMWHISNEFGGYCYCDSCRSKFQDFLRKRYNNDINQLNKAWWATFWSHNFNDFSQIDPPYANGENCVLGLNLDWKRFTTYSTTDFMKHEIACLRKVDPNARVTTNFMELFYDLDYHEMAKELDVISWDSYPRLHNDYSSLYDTYMENAFSHVIYRSMKPGQPFMMMESAPAQVNWQPYNKYRRPGIHRLSCMQAIACGSDTVQYFQWRKGRGSSEQYHGAVVDHLGTDDTRIFKEVSQVGAMLKDIAEIAGCVAKNEVAFLFDWDNRWAIDDARTAAQESKQFEKTCVDLWKECNKLGVDADIISSDMDWGDYKVIIAPMLYLLHDGVGEKIASFVANGGQFLTTYMSGYVDKSTLCHLGGFPGDGLKEVFGIISEELDALYPSDENRILVCDTKETLPVKDYQELLRVQGAQVLATYAGDYVENTAAVTRNSYGKGFAYYVACRLKPEDMSAFFLEMFENAGVAVKKLPQGVEFHRRYDDSFVYEFYLNLNEDMDVCVEAEGQNLLTGETIAGLVQIPKTDFVIIKRQR